MSNEFNYHLFNRNPVELGASCNYCEKEMVPGPIQTESAASELEMGFKVLCFHHAN